MKEAKVVVYEAGEKPRRVAAFDVSAQDTDGLADEAKRKLSARKIRSISHGPAGLVVYIEPRA